MNIKEIIFVRHAESEANAGLPTKDAQSVPLSSRGLQQAEDLVADFPIEPELIVISKYTRTKQTATPLILKSKTARVETWDMVHEFTFLDREKYKNTTTHERQKHVIDYWEKKDPYYKDGPSEESFFDLLKRTENFFEKLEEQKENKIAIFSHGQFLTSLKIVKNLDKKIDMLSKEELSELMTTFRILNIENPIENAEIFTIEKLVN